MYYVTLFEASKETIEGFLRMFKCQRCQPSCCTKVNDGIVVKDSDVIRLADHLGIGFKEFEKQYTFHMNGERRIKGPCPFYSEEINGCTVHDFRPIVCFQFPFNKVVDIKGKKFVTICGDCPAGKELGERFGIKPESVGVKP